MARGERPGFATVREALDRRTVDELKKLLALLRTAGKPTRKGELADFVAAHLEGEKLAVLWKRLDKTHQSAVAETLYAADNQFDGLRFAAKYGESPNWGSRSALGFGRTPSLLQLFISGTVIPEDLQARLREFVSSPAGGNRYLVVPAASETAFRKALRGFDYILPPS